MMQGFPRADAFEVRTFHAYSLVQEHDRHDHMWSSSVLELVMVRSESMLELVDIVHQHISIVCTFISTPEERPTLLGMTR